MTSHFGGGDNVYGDKIQVGGTHNTGKVVQSGADLSQLAAALLILRRDAASSVVTRDDAAAYRAVVEAHEAARRNDGSATASALRRAGRWALENAQAIGVPVAVEAIKRALT